MSSIFDPGKKDRERASQLAREGIIDRGSFSGPAGISGSFNFSGGAGRSSSSLGSFQSVFDNLMRATNQSLTQAQGGLPPELQALGDQTIDTLGQSNVNRLTNESDFGGLGQIFQGSLATAKADPFELGSGIAEKLRALSERRNQRLVNKTFDRLKSSGKLGTSGGAGIAGELDQNLFDEGLKFDLAGLDAGRGLQSDAMARLLGASGQREAIGGRQFGESFALDQAGKQAAMQQFGVGNSMFDSFLRNQAQGTQLGLATNASAMATSQLPLAFQQALLQSMGQASNSRFAAAGVEQNNAQMATSPFLQALNAAGQFASNIAPGGFMGNVKTEGEG